MYINICNEKKIILAGFKPRRIHNYTKYIKLNEGL